MNFGKWKTCSKYILWCSPGTNKNEAERVKTTPSDRISIEKRKLERSFQVVSQCATKQDIRTKNRLSESDVCKKNGRRVREVSS